MFSFRKKSQFVAPGPDFRAGRAFDPLAVTDGNPRVLITAHRDGMFPDGTFPVHIDAWSLAPSEDQVQLWEKVGEMLMHAQRIANQNYAAALQGAGSKN